MIHTPRKRFKVFVPRVADFSIATCRISDSLKRLGAATSIRARRKLGVNSLLRKGGAADLQLIERLTPF
jgi:hypothetical protein